MIIHAEEILMILVARSLAGFVDSINRLDTNLRIKQETKKSKEFIG